jgi:hypothetical protein
MTTLIEALDEAEKVNAAAIKRANKGRKMYGLPPRKPTKMEFDDYANIVQYLLGIDELNEEQKAAINARIN